MKKLLPLLFLLVTPAQADMRHSIKTSASISIEPAYTSTSRGASQYSLSGSNITPSVSVTANGSTTTTSGKIGGLNLGTLSSGVPAAIHTDTVITTAGSAFSKTESFSPGDATPSSATVSSGVVGSLPVLSGTTYTGSGGVQGSLAITSLSSGVHTCSGTGGAGSSCTTTSIIESLVD